MLTGDALFNGKLIVYQQKNGYRFSIDAVLLAGLTQVKAHDRVIDLGTGCGVVPLVLAYRGLGCKLIGLEIQHELAALAEKNVAANGFSNRIEVVRMDFLEVSGRFAPAAFDLVVSNPPYRRLATGRVNPDTQRAIARHEMKASVVDVFAAGKYLLPEGGRLAIIYPAARLDHLLASARQYGFNPKRLTVIYSNVSSPARLVHVVCRKGGGEELHVSPPFFIYEENGAYTEAMRSLYAQ